MRVIDSFKLGNIDVTITETKEPEKYKAECNDGRYRYEFTLNKYEYENYNKLMKQRIKAVFKQQYNNS